MVKLAFLPLLSALAAHPAAAQGSETLMPMRAARDLGLKQLERASQPIVPSNPEQAREEAAERIGEGEGSATVPPVSAVDERGSAVENHFREQDDIAFPMPGRMVASAEPRPGQVIPPAPEEIAEGDQGGEEGDSPFEPGDDEEFPENDSPMKQILIDGAKKVGAGAVLGGLVGLAFGAPWVGVAAGAVVALGLVLWGLFGLLKGN